MSELRSTIESLRAEELGELPDARAEDDFAELQRACELLEVERLRRLADLDRRGSSSATVISPRRHGWRGPSDSRGDTHVNKCGSRERSKRCRKRAARSRKARSPSRPSGYWSPHAMRNRKRSGGASPSSWRRRAVTPCRTSSGSSPSGDSVPSESAPSTPRSASANAERCTPRSRSSGWCA